MNTDDSHHTQHDAPRRAFLRGLGALVLAPKVIHVLPPVGGWRLNHTGLLTRPLRLEDLYLPELVTLGSLVAALRRVDPDIRVVEDQRLCRVELTSAMTSPVAEQAFRKALWYALPIGVQATFNGRWMRNDWGFRKEIV